MPRRKKIKLQSAAQVAMQRSIVNQFGDIVKSPKPRASATMYDASYPWNDPRPRTRVIQGFYNEDFHQNVTIQDSNTILSRAREIYANIGGVHNAIDEITSFVIGDGWEYKYTGPDFKTTFNGKETTYKELSENYVNKIWAPFADIKGSPWTFQLGLNVGVKSVLRDGGVLCVFVSGSSNTPRLQWIPNHKKGSRRNGELEQGMFGGYTCINGTIYNDQGSVIGYNILGADRYGKEDQQVSIFDCQYMYDPDYSDQDAGISALASGVPDFMDYKTMKGFTMTKMKTAANFALQMYVPPEEIDDVAGEYGDSPYKTSTIPTGSRELTVETLQGGEVNIWRPDSGAKLEVLENHSPSSEETTFLLDHCLRNAYLSLGWPVELCYDLNSKGAATKNVYAKAQRRVNHIQTHVVYPLWKRIITWVLAKAIKHRQLPPNPNFWMFEPTYPKDAVLDAYKDIKGDLELYSKCIITGTQLAASHGYDYYSNMEQKAQELAKADEISKKYNINRADLVQLTLQGNAAAEPLKPNKEDEEDTDTDTGSEDDNGNDSGEDNDQKENKEGK